MHEMEAILLKTGPLSELRRSPETVQNNSWNDSPRKLDLVLRFSNEYVSIENYMIVQYSSIAVLVAYYISSGVEE